MAAVPEHGSQPSSSSSSAGQGGKGTHGQHLSSPIPSPGPHSLIQPPWQSSGLQVDAQHRDATSFGLGFSSGVLKRKKMGKFKEAIATPTPGFDSKCLQSTEVAVLSTLLRYYMSIPWRKGHGGWRGWTYANLPGWKKKMHLNLCPKRSK